MPPGVVYLHSFAEVNVTYASTHLFVVTYITYINFGVKMVCKWDRFHTKIFTPLHLCHAYIYIISERDTSIVSAQRGRVSNPNIAFYFLKLLWAPILNPNHSRFYGPIKFQKIQFYALNLRFGFKIYENFTYIIWIIQRLQAKRCFQINIELCLIYVNFTYKTTYVNPILTRHA